MGIVVFSVADIVAVDLVVVDGVGVDVYVELCG